MRTTIDIPDAMYRELKLRAARNGETLKEIILASLAAKMREGQRPQTPQRSAFPVIKSKNPGSLQLGEEGVYEYIPFP